MTKAYIKTVLILVLMEYALLQPQKGVIIAVSMS